MHQQGKWMQAAGCAAAYGSEVQGVQYGFGCFRLLCTLRSSAVTRAVRPGPLSLCCGVEWYGTTKTFPCATPITNVITRSKQSERRADANPLSNEHAPAGVPACNVAHPLIVSNCPGSSRTCTASLNGRARADVPHTGRLSRCRAVEAGAAQTGCPFDRLQY